jgi:hypothetical protein
MTRELRSFTPLYDLLESLGFVRRRARSEIEFEHAESGTSFLFPVDSTAFLPHYVVAVRKILDERGLLSRDEFDRILQNHSPRQSA